MDQTTPPGPNRRNAIAAMLAAGATGPLVRAGDPPPVDRPSGETLRIAHLTDAHVDGRKGSAEGLAACLRHVRSLDPAPSLILNTGDAVMCVNGVDESSASEQWGIWKRVVEAEARVEIVSAIGNHDSWGWDRPSPERPLGGKAMAMDVLGMPGRFYRLDRGAWTFLVLDSIHGSYTGRLDDEQWEWLVGELGAIGGARPVCVATHIPIVTACGFFDGQRFGEHGWTIPGSWMHEDAHRIVGLLAEHPNVKLCLSGHMHQVDRIDFQGVSYVCSGAVSASWWNGRYYQCDYGYGVVDLRADGTFDHRYVPFGWTTRS